MPDWARPLLVGAGGFVGAAMRYVVGGLVHRLVPPSFPWGTFLVNVSGCFAIGFLAVLAGEKGAIGPPGRLFWMIGVLGGFTTFSTFGYESFTLAQDGSHVLAAGNILGQVALGLAAVWAGVVLARVIT